MATTYQEIRAFWRAKPFSTEAAFDTALSRFRILFAYHSGKLENRSITYQDTREIFEKGRVTGFAGNPRGTDASADIQEGTDGGFDQPLVPAAYLHARFEYIHPFADGNGRVGRMLLNYWLMSHHEPPIVLFEEDCKAYYAALEAYDAEEDLKPLVQFLQAQTVRTWDGEYRRSRGESTGLRRKQLRVFAQEAHRGHQNNDP